MALGLTYASRSSILIGARTKAPVSRDASFLAIDLLRRRLVWVFSLDLLSEKLREAGCDDAEIGLDHGHVADDD